MKIQGYSNINRIKPNTGIKNTDVPIRTDSYRSKTPEQSYFKAPYQSYFIAFKGSENSKNISAKIEVEKKRIFRQLKEILDTNYSETAPEDLNAKAQMIAANYFSDLERQLDQTYESILAVYEDKHMTDKAKYDRLGALEKQYKMLSNKLSKGYVVTFSTSPSDEKTDLILINKFKNAIAENNFDLDKVANEHYQKLEEISTIKELNDAYPKIIIPAYPECVIAKKVVSVLTRDFYEKIDEIYDNESNKDDETIDDEISQLIENKIKELLKKSLEKKPEKFKEVYLKTTLLIADEILYQYTKAKSEDKIASIPQNKKIKVPQITDTDLELLSIDYDDFVIDVIKQHYLHSKKLNDIVYEKDGAKINVSKLKEPEYKFHKQQEKIKTFINTALKIKKEERDYDKYDLSSLKSRLNYYATTPIANNESILDTIINFDACKFEKEDIIQLKKFLRELDKVSDNTKTTEEVIETIKYENIKPIGTERLTAEEKIRAEKQYKEEQKKASLLNKIKNSFDETISILFINNLNNLANICTTYRPQSLDREELQKAKQLRDIIKNSVINKNTQKIENKTKIEKEIINWHTFNIYEKNHSSEEIFQKAVEYARRTDNSIDINKAGQYLFNYEIVKTYPNITSYSQNPEILKIIMDKNSEKNERFKAIEYLCKYNEYETLPNSKKEKIQNILKLFNLKDSTDKAILKNIIENDYVNIDTHSQMEQGKDIVVNTVFAKSAKKQILEKYKFPVCIQFLDGFETAISNHAASENSTGIKKTGKDNKALLYKMEAKLAGHDDRLFSSKNDYCFDIYSPIGLH